MNNVVFRKVLKNGKAPVTIEVTEENNGYCVFLCGHPREGIMLLRHNFYDKMGLIEWAVLDAKNDNNVTEALK